VALKRLQIYGLALVVLVIIIAWVVQKMYTPTPVQKLACADLQQACEFKLGQTHYVLQSLQPITTRGFFTLELKGSAQQVGGSWQMQSMDMGPNQYRFLPAKLGVWQAKMALPLCTQARHDWLLRLTIDNQTVEIITSSAGH
jgi:hypothetical protein